ncbi:hypothetical protein [Methylobacterium nonmethylotrophicum]|uniref:PIN domain-containing protein n=1 Tax=Methylobacterium nonmethylotrophicum TaxID=1141884 RepID=A0A4Z0NX64_9HYPH|nr:hypothetical protein [Methylobacterium nonmethylotrophicum]TGE01869.1 hypothetical protein EU555_04145 [Methylobacterium nonmethylotrophicum]
MNRAVILDTQLIVLFTVGHTSREMIKKHKNLTDFSTRDFDLLMLLLGFEPRLVFLPNTVSESANLLRQHREPKRSIIMETFRGVVHSHRERYITSRAATARKEYKRLGVADAAILECCSDRCEILTADADLHVTASGLGMRSTNFNHKREEYGLL